MDRTKILRVARVEKGRGAAKGAAALPGKPAKRPGIPWVWASRRGGRTGKTDVGARPCRTRPRRDRRVNRERFSWTAGCGGWRRHLSRWRGRRSSMCPASEMGEEMAPVGRAIPLHHGDLRYPWQSRLFTTRSISSMDARIRLGVMPVDGTGPRDAVRAARDGLAGIGLPGISMIGIRIGESSVATHSTGTPVSTASRCVMAGSFSSVEPSRGDPSPASYSGGCLPRLGRFRLVGP